MSTRNRFFWTIAAALVVAFAIASSPARATVALYDFENQSIGTETPFTLVSSGLTAAFSGPSGVDPGAFGISSNFATPTGFQYQLMSGDFLTIGSAFGASGSALTITFSAPVTAFTLNFALDDPSNTSTLLFETNGFGAGSGTGVLTSGFRYPEGTLSYAGGPFTSITFRSNALDFQIDNLQATIAAVPEPETVMLFAVGIVAIALRRRRAVKA